MMDIVSLRRDVSSSLAKKYLKKINIWINESSYFKKYIYIVNYNRDFLKSEKIIFNCNEREVYITILLICLNFYLRNV